MAHCSASLTVSADPIEPPELLDVMYHLMLVFLSCSCANEIRKASYNLMELQW